MESSHNHSTNSSTNSSINQSAIMDPATVYFSTVILPSDNFLQFATYCLVMSYNICVLQKIDASGNLCGYCIAVDE